MGKCAPRTDLIKANDFNLLSLVVRLLNFKIKSSGVDLFVKVESRAKSKIEMVLLSDS